MAHALASELYSNVGPMPAFSYLGGDYGKGLLLGALAEPQQTFDGKYLHRTIFDKGAALVCSIIKDHPFIDGNKRMGLAILSLFFVVNDHLIFATNDDMVSLALAIAKNEISEQEVVRWLRKRAMSRKHLNEIVAGRAPVPDIESEDAFQQLTAIAHVLFGDAADDALKQAKQA